MHACMHRIDAYEAYECKKSVGLQAKLAMIRDIFACLRCLQAYVACNSQIFTMHTSEQ